MPLPEAIVRAVKKDYGVDLTPSEIESLHTRRDLYYFLEQRLVVPRPCPSSHAFYQLRQTLMDEFGVARDAVTPSTGVATLLPPGHLVASWSQLRKASGLRLPGLKPRAWLAIPINTMAVLLAVVIGFSLLMEVLLALQDNGVPGGALALGVTGLVGVVGLGIYKGIIGLATRACPAPMVLTVRQLVKQTLGRSTRVQPELSRIVRYRLPAEAEESCRTTLRDALVRYMREDIWSSEFNDAIMNVPANGGSVWWQMARMLWGLYDDLSDHPIRVNGTTWEFLRRLLAALASDLPLQVRAYPRLDLDDLPPEIAFEPFWSARQWQEYEPLLADFHLPSYDAAVHAARLGFDAESVIKPDTEFPGIFQPEMRSFRLASYSYRTFMVEPPPEWQDFSAAKRSHLPVLEEYEDGGRPEGAPPRAGK